MSMFTSDTSVDTSVKTHFDLHGVIAGYVSRIRWVQPKKGEKFLACAILAFRQEAEKMHFTYFDMCVVGEEAIKLIAGFAPAAAEGKQVLAKVRIGDLYVHDYTDGKEAGGTAQLCMKARLLKVLAHEVHDGRKDEAAMAALYGGNMVVRGLGYLNRVNGAFSSISAFHGRVGDVEYISFDTANDSAVLPVVRRLLPSVKADSTVLIGFEVENIYPDSFLYRKGRHAGERGLVVKGCLTRISMAKVNGIKVNVTSEDQSEQRSGTN